MISTIQKYASYGLLVALLVMSGTCAYLWRGKTLSVAQVKELKASNEQLSKDLQSERDWSTHLSEELAKRSAKQKQSDTDRKKAEDKLEKSYDENRDWADAPVPGATTDGLREFLGTR